MGEGLGTRIWGKTLGIIGFGRIGRAVADRARGFGMRIVYHDLRRAPDQVERGAVFFPSLIEMMPRCDFVSLHTPLNASTRHIVNRRMLTLLPRGAIVVNSARGGLIDETSMIELLEAGHLGGAGGRLIGPVNRDDLDRPRYARHLQHRIGEPVDAMHHFVIEPDFFMHGAAGLPDDLPVDDVFAAARRLPPDLRARTNDVIAVYRRQSAGRAP